MEICGDNSDLTVVPTALRAKRDQLNEPPELVSRRRAGCDAANFTSLRGQLHATGFGNQGAAIRDEELEQRQEGDPENQCGNHRVGATTLAVAIRASSGTLTNV